MYIFFIDFNVWFSFQKKSPFSYSKISYISKIGCIWIVLGKFRNASSNTSQIFKKNTNMSVFGNASLNLSKFHEFHTTKQHVSGNASSGTLLGHDQVSKFHISLKLV